MGGFKSAATKTCWGHTQVASGEREEHRERDKDGEIGKKSKERERRREGETKREKWRE